MADLFLSYARPDRAKAQALASALEARGYSVWWDQHIEGGAEFSADIERELTAARVVVVAWSEAARTSAWVKDEAGVGREHGKLVALSLDKEQPPLGFRQYHAVDFSSWEESADADEFKSLLKAIESRSRGEPELIPESAAPDAGQLKGQRLPARRWWGWAALVLVLAVAYLAWSQTQPTTGESSDQTTSKIGGDIPWINVVDFKVASSDLAMGEMASALSESISNGLSRFSWLKVASNVSNSNHAVAYQLEGSLRRSGETMRLTVQLIKTATGEQVWGEFYDEPFSEQIALGAQDELTAKVVASVADSYGALMRDLSAPVASKSPGEMSPYEAILRHMVYRQRVSPADHKAALEALQLAVEKEPGNADAWAMLAAMYVDEFKHDFNQQPDSLDLALEAVQRALELDSNNAFGAFILAEIQFFRKNPGAFQAAAEKAIELNPYDSDSMAMIGILLTYSGESLRGNELARRAMSLNPNHPGWYRMGIVYDQLRNGEYQAALDTAQRINLPQYFGDPLVRSLAHAYLGQLPEARQAAKEFQALFPNQDLDYFRDVHLDRWFYASPELNSLTLEGLKIAGLEFD